MNSSLSLGRIFRERRGIALVSVLVIVVLLTAVILGFLVTSKQEQVSSRSYKASSSARQMADTAVNLVQGQINQATSQGMNYAWASQPGAIRVWDNTGVLSHIYKLYSAENLTETDATKMDIANTPVTSTPTGDPAHPDMPPTTWSTSPSLWVDLNSPVNDAADNARFPIFDETKAATVDGFSVGPTTASPGTTSPPGSTTAQPAPMPVRWLYVLRNGQIIAPDTSSSGTVLTFNTAANAPVAPTTANPIVGRIAFWTDDETCKVNINTAGGDGILNGTDPTDIANKTFWDTPHFTAPDDKTLATSQPVTGEFQRYPGHPATVALNNVLNGLGWPLTSAQFYSLLPRYQLGGSLGATAPADYIGEVPAIPLKASPNNHLYTSVAEMLFNIDRTKSVVNADDSATQQKVETARFFLTAHSRAPEVTLFGQPRISIWPEMVLANVNDIPTTGDPLGRQRTAIDNLLAFCATIPATGSGVGNPYYFTRYDPTSASADISLPRNVALLQYLDYFTSLPIPGYGPGGVSFDSKYTVAGMRQILTEIFDYIRATNVADSTLLAGGANPNTYAQIWAPGTDSVPLGIGATLGLYQVSPSVGDAPTLAGSPSKLGWHTQGFGIYPRLNEVGIQFVAVGQGATPTTAAVNLNSVYGNNASGVNGDTGSGIFGTGDSGTDPNNSGGTQSRVTALTPATTPNVYVPPGNAASGSTSTRAIQAFLLLSFINPSQMQISNGATADNGIVRPALWVRIQGLGAFQVNGHSLGFSNNSTMFYWGDQDSAGWDDYSFVNMLQFRHTAPVPPSSGTGTWLSINPFYSKIIPVKINSPIDSPRNVISFTGGQLTITLYDGGGLNSGAYASNANPPTGLQPIQTYTINFGNNGMTTFSMPTFPPTLADGTSAPWTTFNKTQPQPDTLPCPPSPLPPMAQSFGIANNPTNPVPYIYPGTNPGDRWYTYLGSPGYPWGNGVPGYIFYWQTSLNWAFICMGDVVQSMVLGNSTNPSNPGPWTDLRMLATANVPAAAFSENPLWGQRPFAHNFTYADLPYYSTTATNPLTYPTIGILNGNATYWNPLTLQLYQSYGSLLFAPPSLANGIPYLTGAGTTSANTDWDNGLGAFSDGPWINKADEGSLAAATSPTWTPYFGSYNWVVSPTGAGFFSPNREVPSPGMFGSLSTGVDPNGSKPTPWQTLLFRPFPGSSTGSAHQGWQNPKDHLLLDLFWMPVAEPYAISEPFSTGGKINLNYQIEPFTYITRSTAIRAVLNSEKVAASFAANGSQSVAVAVLPRWQPNGIFYKLWAFSGRGTWNGPNARTALDVNQTLTQFDDKFNGASFNGGTAGSPDIFHSASQICEMYLFPQGSDATFPAKWYNGIDYGLVGDNTRERPYTNIYGQITTKSNTYTVYYTVQSLKNANKDQTKWDENQGAVLGEYRGSSTLERYIDPNQTLPDFAASTNWGKYTVDGDISGAANSTSYYKWRVVDNHPFAP